MNDYYDDYGNLSIFKLMSSSNPTCPADPATRKVRWGLVERRLAQIAAEARELAHILKGLGSPEF